VSIVAGVPGVARTKLGALPGGLDASGGIVLLNDGSFGLVSGGSILRLSAPH